MGARCGGKGGAVHEFVVGVRIVTPASGEEGFARVLSLDARHPEFDAVKVSLGVLGVISQVTLKLEPMFKRSLTYVDSDDTGLGDKVVDFGRQYEFGDVSWFPGHKKAVYRVDFRVPTNASGNGLNDFIGFRSTTALALALSRLIDENLEATNNTIGKCITSKLMKDTTSIGGYGLKNNGILFTGYPVVGFQNRMQSSGSCLDSIEDSLITACPWDPRIKGAFFHQTTFSIALSKVKDFIIDVQKLRDINPKALCELELSNGILMRYVKGSTAFLGKEEDSVDFDITYYRSHDPMKPRLDEDVYEEIEQMGLFKYGGLPHWGKNRNLAFDGVAKKYAKFGEFLEVKEKFDPDGLFSSEWSDEVLGINGKRTSIVKPGCALEGLCICSEDTHCAPAKGYFCRPGKVFTDARVCSKS
ncbi:probable L-gulonolactone oxidase 6 [Dioscorea cayenensis subsp. rotundata]|uniref:L-gulonolactone oxidase n=1 Tax=Dioscorea cayennensis subsp. rotundata TaxID=55577 RepID=A0AB40CGY4_DIOCR|nr:probable L-gulonolactone oxidase 6 [Dioscorea cayenensis subsp. rotundata]